MKKSKDQRAALSFLMDPTAQAKARTRNWLPRHSKNAASPSLVREPGDRSENPASSHHKASISTLAETFLSGRPRPTGPRVRRTGACSGEWCADRYTLHAGLSGLRGRYEEKIVRELVRRDVRPETRRVLCSLGPQAMAVERRLGARTAESKEEYCVRVFQGFRRSQTSPNRTPSSTYAAPFKTRRKSGRNRKFSKSRGLSYACVLPLGVLPNFLKRTRGSYPHIFARYMSPASFIPRLGGKPGALPQAVQKLHHLHQRGARRTQCSAPPLQPFRNAASRFALTTFSTWQKSRLCVPSA